MWNKSHVDKRVVYNFTNWMAWNCKVEGRSETAKAIPERAWGAAYLAEHTKKIAACQFGQLLEHPALTHQLRKQVGVSTDVLDAFRCAERVWKKRERKKKSVPFLAHTVAVSCPT